MASVWHLPCYMGLAHRLIIVRRDQLAILAAILRCPDRWPPGSAVILDRRGQDRRQRIQPVVTDRRHGERRAPPDTPWQMHGFMVAHVDHLPTEAIPLDDVAVTADRRASPEPSTAPAD